MTVGRDPVQKAAGRLLARGVELFVVQSIGPGHELPLTSELLERQPVAVVEVKLPTGVALTADERALLTAFSGSWKRFTASSLTEADAYTSLAAESASMKIVHIQGSDLTDAGLKRLERLAALNQIMVGWTQVSRAGVDAFRAAVPGCRVICDFGNFPPEFAPAATD